MSADSNPKQRACTAYRAAGHMIPFEYIILHLAEKSNPYYNANVCVVVQINQSDMTFTDKIHIAVPRGVACNDYRKAGKEVL